MRISLLIFALILFSACGPARDDDVIVIDTDDKPTSMDDGSSSSGAGELSCDDCDSGEFEQERVFCVEFINELRARVDKPPLERSGELEQCATTAAREDAETGQAHGHFQRTQGCQLTARAENEIPGWDLARFDSIQAIVEEGAEAMFAEGPGGGHYENIVGDYTAVGCGIHVTDTDQVWVVHNFH